MSPVNYRGFEILQNPANGAYWLYRDGCQASLFAKANLAEAKQAADRILDGESRTRELDRAHPDLTKPLGWRRPV